MRVVINKCFGGFDLSGKARIKLGIDNCFDIDRTDQRVIKVVEELGVAANGICSKLAIVEIPDEATDWELEEYDGLEHIIYVLDGKIHRAY